MPDRNLADEGLRVVRLTCLGKLYEGSLRGFEFSTRDVARLWLHAIKDT
jgi:hypothetical protein